MTDEIGSRRQAKAAPRRTAAPRPPRKAPATVTSIAPSPAAEPPPVAPAGWYPSPDDPQAQRYWTGTEWSDTAPPAAEEETPPDANGRRTVDITWHDRTVAVYVPNPTQLMAWVGLADEWMSVSSKGDDNITEGEASALFAGMHRVFMRALASDVDRRWLRDLFLDGAVDMADATQGLLGAAIRAAKVKQPADHQPKKARLTRG